jgi:Flp pilus assembly protein TadB
MLTHALLLKISIAFAALLGLLGFWYGEYHANAAKEAAFLDRIEQAQKRQPTKAQREEALRQLGERSRSYEQSLKRELEGLNGGKK